MQRSPSKNLISWILGGLIILIALAGLTWMNFRFSAQNPGGNDFLARWNGARYWVTQHVSPYADPVGLSTQMLIYNHPADPSRGEDKNLFVYPFYSLIFFGPFGWLDFTSARAIWMTLLECSLVAAVFLALRLARWKISPLGSAGLILFSLFWYPGVRTLILGQYSGINVILILGGLLLVQQKKDVPAGILLALSTSKPQMVFLLIPFTLIWGFSTRRWKLLASLLGGLALLCLGSLILLPSWPVEWLAQMREYPTYTGRIGTVVAIIAGAIPSASSIISIVLYLLLAIWLAIAWIQVWGKNRDGFIWTALLTLVISNLVAFRTATPHYVAFLPILFMLGKFISERSPGIARLFTGLFFGLLLVGLWIVFLVTIQGNLESGLNYVPLPILSLAALAWLRRMGYFSFESSSILMVKPANNPQE